MWGWIGGPNRFLVARDETVRSFLLQLTLGKSFGGYVVACGVHRGGGRLVNARGSRTEPPPNGRIQAATLWVSKSIVSMVAWYVGGFEEAFVAFGTCVGWCRCL